MVTSNVADDHAATAAVRALVTAAKTVRLYPPSSPIPLAAIQSTVDALDAALGSEPALPLVVAEDGFTLYGTVVSPPGAGDMARMLTAHGVADVTFLPGCTAEELTGFLDALLKDPDTLESGGGITAALSLSGVRSIHLSEVVLTTLLDEEEAAEDLDDFLRTLASDPARLAAWLATAVKGDPGALADGLLELARAAGSTGIDALVHALGLAFLAQDTAGKDTLIGVALGKSEAASLLCSVLRSLRAEDLALALSSGLYGANMLSLSHVLTALPFGDRLTSILEEIRPMLVEDGREERELEFFEHMIEVRSKTREEVPLSQSVPDYRTVAALSAVPEADVTRARTEAETSGGTVRMRTIRTMLSLLDQQQDFELWAATLNSLAAAVPSLFLHREFALANRVLGDIVTRESRTTKPWPGVAEQVRKALDRAVSAEAMAALLAGVLDQPEAADVAREILRRAGATAQQRLVEAALDSEDPRALDVAGELLGGQFVDLLVALAPQAEPRWVGRIAACLARESEPRPRQALQALAHRPDVPSRVAVAETLAGAATPAAVQLLTSLARDSSAEVAAAAVRALGTSATPGGAAALGSLFDSLDSDGKDFGTAREVLGALARTSDPTATSVLEHIAARRAFIKRGHFVEVQDLATRALAMRSGKEAER